LSKKREYLSYVNNDRKTHRTDLPQIAFATVKGNIYFETLFTSDVWLRCRSWFGEKLKTQRFIGSLTLIEKTYTF